MADEIAVQGGEGADFPVRGSNWEADGVTLRIREAASLAGGKAALAAKSGISERTIGYLFAGQDVKLSQLRKIAGAANIHLEWLASGRGPMRAGDPGQDLVIPPQAGPPAAGTVEVQRYDVGASAGRRRRGFLEDGRVVERMVFSEEWVRRVLRRNPANLAVIEAWGDSMAPTIGDGDVLMLDIQPDGLKTGRIYVVEVDGELLVKRIQRRMTGQVVVLSDNAAYAPEELSREDVQQLRVIGEVVWSGRVI